MSLGGRDDDFNYNKAESYALEMLMGLPLRGAQKRSKKSISPVFDMWVDLLANEIFSALEADQEIRGAFRNDSDLSLIKDVFMPTDMTAEAAVALFPSLDKKEKATETFKALYKTHNEVFDAKFDEVTENLTGTRKDLKERIEKFEEIKSNPDTSKEMKQSIGSKIDELATQLKLTEAKLTNLQLTKSALKSIKSEALDCIKNTFLEVNLNQMFLRKIYMLKESSNNSTLNDAEQELIDDIMSKCSEYKDLAAISTQRSEVKSKIKKLNKLIDDSSDDVRHYSQQQNKQHLVDEARKRIEESKAEIQELSDQLSQIPPENEKREQKAFLKAKLKIDQIKKKANKSGGLDNYLKQDLKSKQKHKKR